MKVYILFFQEYDEPIFHGVFRELGDAVKKQNELCENNEYGKDTLKWLNIEESYLE